MSYYEVIVGYYEVIMGYSRLLWVIPGYYGVLSYREVSPAAGSERPQNQKLIDVSLDHNLE